VFIRLIFFRILQFRGSGGLALETGWATVTDMLRELIEVGRRILIFSGFTKMLDMPEKTCGQLNVTTAKLTGATRDRDAEIKKFRESGTEVV
jgi:SNF2 family DNA or RNA helicase